MTAGRPKLYNSVEEIKPIIDNYFKECDSKTEYLTDEKTGKGKVVREPYTVSGLCIALKMTRETLREYEKDPKFSDTIKTAKQKIENWLEKYSLMGVTNPTVSIFNLKNNFGWKDKTETELTGKDGGAIEYKRKNLTDEEIKARILELQSKAKI